MQCIRWTQQHGIHVHQQALSIFIRSLMPAGSLTSSSITSQYGQRSLRRTITTVTSRLQEHSTARTSNEDSSTQPDQTHTTAQQSSKPWYLQERYQEQDHAHPFAHRQQLPDLPLDPPDLLQPILEYLSKDAGLDFLTLLDLRKLDPPPALGANVIMIVGSARSFKHLNSSAARFSGWLRTEHGLETYADGLLGRGELKLMSKRRARRMKIMGAAGGSLSPTQAGSVDTGWICVNAGPIFNKTVHDSTQTENSPGFVGFGKSAGGTRIVVQMMTEEKRTELDLEGLWEGYIEKSAKKSTVDIAQPLAAPAGVADSLHNTASGSAFNAQSPASIPRVSANNSTSFQQVRRFSTSRSPLREDVHDSNEALIGPESQPTIIRRIPSRAKGAQDADSRGHKLSKSSARRPEPLDWIYPSRSIFARAPYDNFESRTVADPQRQHPERVSKLPMFADWPIEEHHQLVLSGEALRAGVAYLENLPADEARALLDAGTSESSDTFLDQFNACVPPFQTSLHFECNIQLQILGLRLGHRLYSKYHLLGQLRRMINAGFDVPEHIFHAVLNTVLQTPHFLAPVNTKARQETRAAPAAILKSLDLAIRVLAMMEVHSYKIATPQIFLAFHEAVTEPRFTSHNTTHTTSESIAEHLTPSESAHLQRQLRRVMALYLPKPWPESLVLALLRTYRQCDNWKALIRVFRDVALDFQPRTPEMYEELFSAAAASNSQKHCRHVLAEWVPMMQHERPPVLLEGSLSLAVAKCLSVAQVGTEMAMWRGMVEQTRRALLELDADADADADANAQAQERAGKHDISPSRPSQELSSQAGSL